MEQLVELWTRIEALDGGDVHHHVAFLDLAAGDDPHVGVSEQAGEREVRLGELEAVVERSLVDVRQRVQPGDLHSDGMK